MTNKEFSEIVFQTIELHIKVLHADVEIESEVYRKMLDDAEGCLSGASARLQVLGHHLYRNDHEAYLDFMETCDKAKDKLFMKK